METNNKTMGIATGIVVFVASLFLFTTVGRRILDIYQDFGAELPFITSLITAISSNIFSTIIFSIITASISGYIIFLQKDKNSQQLRLSSGLVLLIYFGFIFGALYLPVYILSNSI